MFRIFHSPRFRVATGTLAAAVFAAGLLATVPAQAGGRYYGGFYRSGSVVKPKVFGHRRTAHRSFQKRRFGQHGDIRRYGLNRNFAKRTAGYRTGYYYPYFTLRSGSVSNPRHRIGSGALVGHDLGYGKRYRNYGYGKRYRNYGYGGPYRNYGYGGPYRNYGYGGPYRNYGYGGPYRSYGYGGPYRNYGYYGAPAFGRFAGPRIQRVEETFVNNNIRSSSPVVMVGAGGGGYGDNTVSAGVRLEEKCSDNHYCVLRLGNGPTAPKIITLNASGKTLEAGTIDD